MTKLKHSLAPWTAQSTVVNKSAKKIVWHFLVTDPTYADGTKQLPLTGRPGIDYPETREATEEAEANARVIAMAPDTYDACWELLHGDGTNASLQRAINLARIAFGLEKRDDHIVQP